MPDPLKPSVRVDPRVRASFQGADENQDGALDALEATRQLGLTPAQRDEFDADGDQRITWSEFTRPEVETLVLDVSNAPLRAMLPSTLVARLDRQLPAENFDEPMHRERILERAGHFAEQVAQLSSDPASPLYALLASVPSDARVELHGVASHFGPETLQAHVTFADGSLQVWVLDGQQRWVERPDLAAKVQAGLIPSSDPGLLRDGEPKTATFAIASVNAQGGLELRIPDVSRFDHLPRLRPFQVGDRVQVTVPLGVELEVEPGEAFVPAHDVQFGTLVDTDGRGSWTVRVERPPGFEEVVLSDQELRRMNNPHWLRSGERLWDAGFDDEHPSQVQLLGDWHESPEYQSLVASWPGPNAEVQERVTWEQEALRQMEHFLDARIAYPATEEGLFDRLNEHLGFPWSQTQEDVFRVWLPEATLPEVRKFFIGAQANIGDYYLLGEGECRHQALAAQVLLQDLAMESRITSGVANDANGVVRGEHLWLEVTLSDGTQWMVDPTWATPRTPPLPLEPTYDGPRSREELPGHTERPAREGGYDDALTLGPRTIVV